MSGTANEFDETAANSPDRKDSDGTQQSSTAGVGGAIHSESGDNPAGVQDEPVLEQNAATTQDQIAGIVAQTRADLGSETDERYAEVLRQRLEDAGIQMTDDDVQSLSGEASPGSSGSGGGGV